MNMWILYGAVYGTVIYHVHRSYKGNERYISAIYKKPSFGRYNDSISEDFRSIKDEIKNSKGRSESFSFRLR